jgi:hypothetical protein
MHFLNVTTLNSYLASLTVIRCRLAWPPLVAVAQFQGILFSCYLYHRHTFAPQAMHTLPGKKHEQKESYLIFVPCIKRSSSKRNVIIRW